MQPTMCAMWSVLLVTAAPLVAGSRVLAVLPFPSSSHWALQEAVLGRLAAHGHEVVVYSTLPLAHTRGNLTHVLLSSSLLQHKQTWTFDQFKQICNIDRFYGFEFEIIWQMGMSVCVETFNSEEIKSLLRSDEKFDLVFVEATFGQESMAVFGHKFQAPIVNFQGFSSWSLVDWVTGNSLSLAHIPELRSFSFTNHMSLVERLRNTLSAVITILCYHLYHLPKHEELIRKHYSDPKMPPLFDMLRDISITLVNAHPLLEYPRPYPPNVIPIAGAHLPDHVVPLPQDIQQFMDDAEEGVILFSLGTIVPTHIFPRQYIQAFVNTFKRMPLKVLWKINTDSLPELPGNVMLTKWVPQPSVLGHKHCQLFITHGGLFSQYEALYSGVPVIGIPFFADQRHNVRYYEQLGVGVKLEFSSITEDNVFKTITTVLNNTRFKEKAVRVSQVSKDRPPLPPGEAAVYWLEYVLRHHGARHLRPAAAALPWTQTTLLDVLTAMVSAAFLLITMVYIAVRTVLRRCVKPGRQ